MPLLSHPTATSKVSP